MLRDTRKSDVNIDFTTIIQQILRDFRKKNDKLYLFPDFPVSKLANARKVCKVPDDEQIMGLIDSTIFGSAKYCILFGARCLYYHRSFSTPGIIPYTDFPIRTFMKSRFTPKLIVTDYGDDLSIGGSNISSDRFCDLLNVMKNSVKSVLM